MFNELTSTSSVPDSHERRDPIQSEFRLFDFSGIFPDFRFFFHMSLCLKIFLKNSHQGKESIVSKSLVSCLWGCVESVNPPKLNIQEVQWAVSSRPNRDPGLLPIFQDFVHLSNYTPEFLLFF